MGLAQSNVVGFPSGGLTESFDLSQLSIGGTLPATAKSEGYSS